MKLLPTLSLLALAGVSSVASAETLFGVDFNNRLITFDSATPSLVPSALLVTGLGGSNLVGIDFRPATGGLYGITDDARLVLINTTTAAATVVGALGVPLNGSNFGVSFNPVADRIRVTSDTRQNLRLDPTTGVATVDGTITYVDGTTTTPQVTGTAYTNPVAGATTLYGLDAFSNTLVSFNSPNAGTISTVGPTGVNNSGLQKMTFGPSGTLYASIQPVGVSGSSLYTINTATGAATNVGIIGSGGAILQLRGLAAVPVPEPASFAVLGVGLLALVRRKRSK